MSRKEKNYHYLYKTTCLKTGNYYIGIHSTDCIDDGYLGSGRRLRYSVRKYGKEFHIKEILEFFPSRSSLLKRESELVNEALISDWRCMNIALGGGFGFSTDERTKQLSKKGHEAFRKKLKESPEMQKWFADNGSLQLKKIHESGNHNYATFTGKSHTEETKEKMRLKAQQRIGEKNSSYGTCWITNGSENKKIKKTEDLPKGWSHGRKVSGQI